MDPRSLRETRQHGSPDFPVGMYRVQREAGEPILDSHWHSETEFIAVEEGQAVFQIGLIKLEAHAGDVLYIPGGELHGGYPLDGSSCTFTAVVFDIGWLSGLDGITAQFLKPLQHGDIMLPFIGSKETPWAIRAYERLLQMSTVQEASETVKEMRVKAAMYDLLADFAGSGLLSRRDSVTRTPDRLKRVLSHMEENFARKLTIGELAEIAAMSEGHFCRVFKTFLRRTPIDYLNRLRLRDAAEKLRQPGVSVAEAALESGFDNFSYFSKMFRSVYDCTPSQYRKCK